MKHPILRQVTGSLLALALGLAPGKASASGSVSDNFETDDGTWWFDGQGQRGGDFATSYFTSGHHSVMLKVHSSSAWSAVARVVDVPGFTYYAPTRCTTSFNVRSYTTRSKVTIEIIDPATWTYIATRSADIYSLSGWKKLTTLEWQPYGPEVVVRLTHSASTPYQVGMVFADDMKTNCR